MASETAGAAGGQGSSGLPQLNPETWEPQLIWLAISFIALYFLMSRIALPRIGGVIQERRERIQRDLDEAERLRGETDQAIAAYEQALAEARGKANQISQANRDKLNAELDAERKSVDQQIAAQIAEAEQQINTSKSAALEKVSEIASATSAAIVSRVLGMDVADDEARQAVSESSRH